MSARPSVRWVCDRSAQESADLALPAARPGAPIPPPEVPPDWARINIMPILDGVVDLCPACRSALARWYGEAELAQGAA